MGKDGRGLSYPRGIGQYTKPSLFRKGSYRNKVAQYGVRVWSKTGRYRDYIFMTTGGRNYFVNRVRRLRNFKSLRYFKYNPLY